MIISLFETVKLSVSISPRNLYNSLKSIKEIGSDHDLVMMTFRVRLKKAGKQTLQKLRFDLEELKDPGPKVIKLFSCSTQLSMKFFLLINVNMPTIVGILTFMSRKNSILGLSESEKS